MSEITFSKMSFPCLSRESVMRDYPVEPDNDRKINKLLKSISRDGALRGEGKPEKLKHKEGEYSRRIDKENRLVYEFFEDKITVKTCRGHYED